MAATDRDARVGEATHKPDRKSGTGRLARFVPPTVWLRGYDRDTLRDDTVAGLTVAFMLVPQAMAYASLAGLPPVAGLYASVVPLVVYALLGTSGQLAVGPVAITALLTASAVAPLADGDPVRYGLLASLLALLAGALQIALGLVRAGALVSFLSHSVIVGFTAGAAALIAASQLSTALGVDAERAATLPAALAAVGSVLGDTHWPTLAVTVTSIVFLLAIRRLAPRVPGSLLLLVAATAVVAGLGLADAGVAVVGSVPAGLPGLSLPSFDTDLVTTLLPAAAAIALVAYAESVSVAKALAARTRDRIDPDQELLAIGSANIAASLSGAFPVAGGFARSAVQASAGARTPMTGVVSAALVALTVVALTPLFTYLPKAALAGLILVALTRLVDLDEMRRVLTAGAGEGPALLLTLAATMILGAEPGLVVGVAIALGTFLWRTSRPHTAEIGRVEGTALLRNVARWPVRTDPRFYVLRVDGPLYFANAARIADQLRDVVATRPELSAIVLDASAVAAIDASAAYEIAHVAQELDEAGVPLHLATVRGPVRDVLGRAGGPLLSDRDRTHRTVHDALAVLAPDGSPLMSADESEQPPENVV